MFAQQSNPDGRLHPQLMICAARYYDVICRQNGATTDVIAYELDAAATSEFELVHAYIRRTGISKDIYAGGLNRLKTGSAGGQITDGLNALHLAMKRAGVDEKLAVMARCSIVGHIIAKSPYANRAQRLLGTDQFFLPENNAKPLSSNGDETMWPFTTKRNEALNPLLKRFKDIMENPRCLECFESVASGLTRNLPLDVAGNVQEAITLSNSITSIAAINANTLIRAIKSDNLGSINDRLQRSAGAVDNDALDSSRRLKRIIEWANDHKLPEFSPHDAFTYKEIGVPRDIRKLNNMRWLLVNQDHGITEIPGELAQLPLLQGICITNNRVRAIPTALYKCPTLQRVDLENNEITRIEDGIQAMRNVHAIDLSGNKLTYVTPDIAKMPNLQKLDISKQRNPIDFMRAANTPLGEESLIALHELVRSIDVKY